MSIGVNSVNRIAKQKFYLMYPVGGRTIWLPSLKFSF